MIFLGSELTEIRNKYPSIISAFRGPMFFKTLSEYPGVIGRIEQERAFLPDEIAGGIFDIELVMKFLIEDGGSRELTSDSYLKLKTSHSLFGVLAAEQMDRHIVLETQERDAFTEIGQRLLRSVRLFDLNPDSVDTGYNKLHEDENTNFAGLVAEMTLQCRVITALKRAGDRESLQAAKNMSEDLKFLLQRTHMNHPDKYREIDRRFGIPDQIGQEWAQHLGGPEESYKYDFFNR